MPNALPAGALVNTGYCLADIGDAYLVYAPGGGTITLNLSGASGSLNVEWLDPDNGQPVQGSAVTGGGSRTFNPPFSGEAVLFVHRAGSNSGDVTNDGVVNSDDLVQIILWWGPCAGCAADINDDGAVNADDLVIVILQWQG